MNECDARALIELEAPDLVVSEIRKIGEGLDNTAFEVNRGSIFRFPKHGAFDPRREKGVLQLVRRHSPLPTPEVTCVTERFITYKKLPGKPLLHHKAAYKTVAGFERKIGELISCLHRVPAEEARAVGVVEDGATPQGWLEDARHDYEQVKHLLPEKLQTRVAAFMRQEAIPYKGSNTFVHNDLGTEHILVDHGLISGIIDWSEAALADPATDLERIYRDLGPQVFENILAAYDADEAQRSGIRERALFYARCSVFGELVYGTRATAQPDDLYLTNAQEALERLF